jgi:hypothetical protein
LSTSTIPSWRRPSPSATCILGQGLLPTRLLSPGQAVVDRYRLRVPPSAPAPAELRGGVGLYDYHSPPASACQRDRVSRCRWLTWRWRQLPGSYPNPVSYNFGDELELVGYRVEPRRTRTRRNNSPVPLLARRCATSRATTPSSPSCSTKTRPAGRQSTSSEHRWPEHLPVARRRNGGDGPGLEPDTPAWRLPIIVGAYRDNGRRRLAAVTIGRERPHHHG